ncbi:hypothetical protein HNP84_004115 [Thermocatellispora tengchongensis]|uniref:Lantibiotic dehydratase N-terminal domain-containing protein n=1 Tax=Thermocatellispora tengchongensis TaxID=1073253 RepID=A0A840P8Z0_9ACTN|nr:lantibiotic dehydratase [Thermocatellispora tengchongensis]MBB5134383.1 hypothetical protein [Thermocatellispora tengchongensis]
MYPRLLLRRAGFPFELLYAVADGPAAGAAEVYRDRVRALEAVRGALLQEIPKAVVTAAAAGDRDRLRALSRCRRRVARRLPAAPADLDEPLPAAPADLGERLPVASADLGERLPGAPVDLGETASGDGTAALLARYAAAVRALERARCSLDAVLAEEAGTRAERVAGVLRDERVLDALLQLAPSFHREAERRLRVRARDDAKGRAFLRRAYLYVQRLAAKNETTGFFGPLVHGEVDPSAAGIALGPETPGGVLRAEAFVAFWAVCRLAERMAADPEVAARLPVTWVPACRREPVAGGDRGAITLPGGRRVALTHEQWRVVALIDGSREAGRLATESGVAPGEVDALVTRLRRAGAVRLAPEPPSAMPRPLDWLIARAERYAGGTHWPKSLRGLREAAARYCAAPDHRARAAALAELERVFSGLAGAQPRREGGKMYADRLVAFIDAEGDQSPVRVGGDVARRWEAALGPVLDAAAHYGELRRRAAAGLCAAVMRAAGAERMPYDELIRRLRGMIGGEEELPPWPGHGARPPAAGHGEPARRFAAALAELAERRRIGVESVLDPAELAALHPPAAGPCFAAPDLLLEARPGRDPRLVLGEMHPYVFAWGSQGLFSPDPEGLLAAFEEDLSPWGGRERLVTVIRRRRHKGLVAEWFPGRFVEITATATADGRRTVPITDLTVTLRDGEPVLSDAAGPVVLYAGEDQRPHLAAFAPPAAALPLIRTPGAALAPRVVVGDVVVQRARWWITPSDLGLPRYVSPRENAGRGGDAFAAAQRLRVTREVPRFVFAHVPGEPKPVGIDLDNPLAVEALVALVAGALVPVALSEMRPGPEGLWLRHGGRPTTSEFRLALRRVPA